MLLASHHCPVEIENLVNNDKKSKMLSMVMISKLCMGIELMRKQFGIRIKFSMSAYIGEIIKYHAITFWLNLFGVFSTFPDFTSIFIDANCV